MFYAYFRNNFFTVCDYFFFLPTISKFFRVVNSVDDYTLILIVYKVCALLSSSNETMVKRESSLLHAKPVLSNMYTDPMICVLFGLTLSKT